MKRVYFLVVSALLAACGGPTTFAGVPVAEPGFGAAPTLEALKTHPHVYWTLFAGSTSPQAQVALVPLGMKSRATSIFNNGNNELLYSSGMRVDSSGRLWIFAYGPYSGHPGSAYVFNVPFTSKSAPKYTFVLSSTSDPDHLAFDALGNLWVNSYGNKSVVEYAGPFTKSGTLTPKLTLTKGLGQPSGIALDKSGNLYVSNLNSKGKNSIAVFARPISNRKPKYLNGLSAPGGLIFDKHGNLYASDNVLNAIVRFNSNDLTPGDRPSIVDSSGLPSQSYESDFAFSATGDLYFANCGNAGSAGIDVYPTSKKPFNSKLAPSVLYTNSYITSVGCAWGIALR